MGDVPVFLPPCAGDDDLVADLSAVLEFVERKRVKKAKNIPMFCRYCQEDFDWTDCFQAYRHTKRCKKERREAEEKRLRESYSISLSICILLRPHAGIDQKVSSLICDRYYVGNEECARDEAWLRQTEVKAVINCAVELDDIDYPYPIECVYLRLNDNESSDLESKWNSVVSFVKSFDVNDKILIHCRCGVSRAPSVLLGILLLVESLSLYDSFRSVKSAREQMYPNKHFLDQLLRLEKKLHNRNSIPVECLLLHEDSL